MQIWHTPFKTPTHPSVSFSDNSGSGGVELEVRPNGLDGDTAYSIKFELLVAFRAYVEGIEPDDFSSHNFSHESCCYLTDDSGWKREFTSNLRHIETCLDQPSTELNHFVILGGDWIVEILGCKPAILELKS